MKTNATQINLIDCNLNELILVDKNNVTLRFESLDIREKQNHNHYYLIILVNPSYAITYYFIRIGSNK
jgi:hypothetical protein